jgi:predicted dehydrogenase
MATWSRRDIIRTLGLSAALPFSSLEEIMEIPIHNEDHYYTNDVKKTVTAIVIGAGARGTLYGRYGTKYPDQLKIIGVAEPIVLRNEKFSNIHSIDKGKRFNTWEDVFKVPKFADAVIITTPDDLHYGPCMKALEMGYDVLLEKPISPSEQQCRDILNLAKKNKRIVAVCHVLRYSEYWIKIKELLDKGILGKVISIQHLEPIGNIHMSHSYVRGNWHDSKKTTPIILAKSCHDLDIIKWLVNKPVKYVQAFGNLTYFKSENAPTGSTQRCMDGCAVESSCPYSALKIYHRNRQWTHVLDLPEDKDKHGEYILNKLATTNYGRCVFRMDNDQPDHYVCNLEFDDQTTVAFSMEAHISYEGRRTRILGTKGDITGDMKSFTHNDFASGKSETWEQQVTDGHGGGDFGLVAQWLRAVSAQDASMLSSTIDASIESHIMGFSAEKSRLEKKVVKVKL